MTTPVAVVSQTFLQLCQQTADECGVSGGSTVPTTVVAQTGELRRIVRWVRSAWRDIQGTRHFSWMWELVPITVPLSTNVVAATVPANRYVESSAYKTSVSSDGLNITYIPWESWRDWYSDAYIAGGNGVTAFTIRPSDNAIVANGIPTVANGGAVTFNVERYALPTDLLVDADVPGMPADLQELIVFKAAMRYASFDEAGVMRKTMQAEVARLEADLFSRCLPRMRLGGTFLDEDY